MRRLLGPLAIILSLLSAAPLPTVAKLLLAPAPVAAHQIIPPGGRLTLADGYPRYAPFGATPTSTDTGADTVTFSAAPGWAAATKTTPNATAGGLTAGSVYYVCRVSATVFSFHTTVANAEACSSPVDLTASIGFIFAKGIASTSIKYCPYVSNEISLWTGTHWETENFSPTGACLSVSLGTLTSDTPYGVLAKKSGVGVELVIDATALYASEGFGLTQQDGVWVAAADKRKTWLGVLRTVSTTTTEDSWAQIGSASSAKRFIWNFYNRESARAEVADSTTHNYNSTTPRQWNADPINQVEFMVGITTRFTGHGRHTTTNSTGTGIQVGFCGANVTTFFEGSVGSGMSSSSATNRLFFSMESLYGPGVFRFGICQSSNATANNSFVGTAGWIVVRG